MHSRQIERIRSLARQLAARHPRSDDHIALLGFVTGALFALDLAAQLGYDDARATPKADAMATEFSRALEAIEAGRVVPTEWQAGHAFNSALMRLSALNERIDKARGEQRDVGASVRRHVNTLKHDVDGHISGKKPITFLQAVETAEALCKALLDSLPSATP